MAEKVLAVIGAGPKGVAIAAKREVLARLGYKLPPVRVFDAEGVAAHWDGKHGYTDGRQPLGTPPEKDIGFPYNSSGWKDDAEVNRVMMEYSWRSFLVSTGEYARWVDRGKPPPSHRLWGEYLCWVAAGLDDDVFVNDELRAIAATDDGWELEFADPGSVEACGLVITGPGPARPAPMPVGGESPHLMDGRSFWLSQHLSGGFGSGANACVIGGGETAAAIVVKLVSADISVDVISRNGVLYTRGESYEENRLYSEPARWRELNSHSRLEFVRRTDRGVFSVASKQLLDQAEGLQTIAGEVERIGCVGDELIVKMTGAASPISYDFVVCATGFNASWFVELMDDVTRDCLYVAAEVERDAEVAEFAAGLERHIAEDLSVAGFAVKLHLPMLAALEQGPGFPNLSCLGLLSDRILAPYQL